MELHELSPGDYVKYQALKSQEELLRKEAAAKLRSAEALGELAASILSIDKAHDLY